MKWVTAHQGQLQVQTGSTAGRIGEHRHEDTWDLWQGHQAIAPAAVHELLFDAAHPAPMFPALLLARQAVAAAHSLIWCDPAGVLYPPAVALAGVPVERLCVVRPKPSDVVWTVGECLQCRGARAVVAFLPSRLTRTEVRRLQLAAERGGNGVGLFLRPLGPGADIYAAATRWFVSPAPGERTVQRWKLQLLHGHGRHLDQTFFLEKRRGSTQTNLVRLPPALADRPPLPARPLAI